MATEEQQVIRVTRAPRYTLELHDASVSSERAGILIPLLPPKINQQNNNLS